VGPPQIISSGGQTRFLMNFLPEDKRPAKWIAFMQGRLKNPPTKF